MPSRGETLEAILELAKEAEDQVSFLTSFLTDLKDQDGNYFDMKAMIPERETPTSSVIATVGTLVTQISNLKSGSSVEFAPKSWLEELAASLRNLAETEKSIVTSIEEFKTSSGGIKSINQASFQLSGLNGNTHSMSRAFQRLYDFSEQSLQNYFRLIPVFRPTRGSSNFQAAAQSLRILIERLSGELEDARESHSQLLKIIEQLEGIEKHATGYKEESKKSAEEAGRQRDESSKARQTISEYLAEATNSKESIDSVASAAAELRKTVDNYKAKFDAFDSSLAQREDALEAGNFELERLQSRFKEQEHDVDELVNQAETMLKGATNSGLAAHYGKVRDDLSDELGRARKSFLFGIVFLSVSMVPLLALVLAPIFGPMFGTVLAEPAETGWQFFGQVVGRFVILLPAAWFVRFASIRHASLFRLREHYNYKYSMAASVEGFKHQAKKYEEEIAAITLEQLAFNPADRLTPSNKMEEGRIPHPMMDYFHRLVDRRMKSLDP